MNTSPNNGLSVNEIIPIKLVSGQDRISEYIDSLNAILKQFAVKPSTFLEGATFLCNPYIKHNPDWIAQSAHSFREIGYLFSGTPTRARRFREGILVRSIPFLRKFQRFSQGKSKRSKKAEGIIRAYLEEADAAVLASRITEITHIFAGISHHHAGSNGDQRDTLKRLKKLGLATDTDTVISEDIFLNLGRDFLNTIYKTVSAHLTIHKNIDLFCEKLEAGKVNKRELAFLLASTTDARKYFFATVLPMHFGWLRNNGFFEVVKQGSEDLVNIRYRNPELDYLVRVADTNAKEVVDFMLSFDTALHPNLETIDRFLWICTKLPADQLARIVPIIRDKQWSRILGNRNHWGFGYKQMFDTLSIGKDHKNIITLSESILTVRSSDDIEKTSFGLTTNPFYFSDLHYSEVFERLSEIDAHVEYALKITAKTFGAIVLLSGEREDNIFPIGDMFSLFDIDFFTLTVGHGRHMSARDDVKDLAAVVKDFTTRLIAGSCDNPIEVRRLYEKYIVPLPDARSIWRFRLYVWSLCPDIFKKELKDAFFRGLQSEETIWPITGGAEYEQALKKGFKILSKSERKTYIKRAFELLGADKHHAYGFGIFSSIYKYLSHNDRKNADELFKRPLDPDYIPAKSIGESYAGTVVPQSPPNSENEWKKTVPEIVDLLKTTWTPAALQKTDKGRDFLKPINAEGVADAMIANIKDRLKEYVACAPLFFDRNNLDSHYAYSFLRGLQEAIRANRQFATTIDWAPFIKFGIEIADSGIANPFDLKRDREQFDGWLSGWNSVHSTLADVIKEILRDEEGKEIIDFALHRNDLLKIISYLLTYLDPQPADEKLETAKMKSKVSGADEYEVSDPLTVAINTTRGRAFETFVYFTEQDGKKFTKDAKSKLSEDVRLVYEEILAKENTRAIMFLFGQYFAFFYYRDHVWMEKNIVPILFSKDTDKKDLYLSAWEGYLSSPLYDELFKRLHDEYVYAVKMDVVLYTKRLYRNDLDEALATHIALAYMHFKDFDLESDLFKLFWNTKNTKRQSAFVSFIGRTVISRDQPIEWLKEHPEVDPKKLELFWQWALTNCNDEQVLEEFGFWMQTKDNIFDPIWLADHIEKTFEKTNGDIKWEIGFIDSIQTLSKVAPEKTLSSLRRHLIDGSILKEARGYIRVDANLIEVLKTLYNNPSTKDGTYKLANELIPIGGGQFWGLKDIFN